MGNKNISKKVSTFFPAFIQYNTDIFHKMNKVKKKKSIQTGKEAKLSICRHHDFISIETLKTPLLKWYN